MKEFFKNTSKKKKVEIEQSEKSPLETLAYAISDVGLFTWYSAELPKYAQLEFKRTMLFFEPIDPGSAPSNHIALQFGNVKSVHIYCDPESQLPENWLELFTGDKLEAFDVDYEFFSFEKKEIEKMVAGMSNLTKLYGEDIGGLKENEGFEIGFRAGEIAMVLYAERMRIMTHAGEVDISSIPNIHHDWWDYWKRYWAVID